MVQGLFQGSLTMLSCKGNQNLWLELFQGTDTPIKPLGLCFFLFEEVALSQPKQPIVSTSFCSMESVKSWFTISVQTVFESLPAIRLKHVSKCG